jgi:hypothetical protein
MVAMAWRETVRRRSWWKWAMAEMRDSFAV